MTKYDAPNETIERYDRNPHIIVIDARDHIAIRHLGGMPTPALIDICNDGRGHEAWRTESGIWRLKDDAYDAKQADFDGTYTKVIVGISPYYEEAI
jgi:hypothetical protein